MVNQPKKVDEILKLGTPPKPRRSSRNDNHFVTASPYANYAHAK